MKLFIVLAVSMMILASIADVSDAAPDRCGSNGEMWCTLDIQPLFCAENSRGVKKEFDHTCDMDHYNCVKREDFEWKREGKC